MTAKKEPKPDNPRETIEPSPCLQEAYHEFVADSMSTLFDDGNLYEILTELKAKDKTVFDYIKKFFDDLAAKVRSLYANTQAETDEGQFVQGLSKDTVYRLQQLFADALAEASENYSAKAQKNTDAEIGVQYSASIGQLTDADVLELIENCNRGEYALRTYIPVRRDTPSILLERSRREGLKPLDNRPIIMLVEHVQQCMDDEVAANDGKRGHALTAQNILDITKALDEPRYIFYQQDNGKYSMIVEYDMGHRSEKGMAIVDVTRDKNPDQMNGFEGGKYNILVTAYTPESGYLKKYIKSENNRCIYDKKEDASQRSSGSLVPSLLNESSSNESLPQSELVVKKNDATKIADGTEPVASNMAQFRNQDRAATLSNRELLAQALESVAANVEDYHSVKEYRRIVPLLDAEEAKLSRINAQIREMTFGKGEHDSKKLVDLRVEAKQTQNRIDIYDKQLLRLEATAPLQKVLEREKAKAYKRAEQKGKEAVQKEKERAQAKYDELAAKNTAARKKGIESRNKTAMRHKIQNVVKELNQYLLKGTKDRHVPIGLQKVVAEALDAVNMDTVGAEERIAKLKADLMQAKTPEKIDAYTVTMENIKRQGEKMGQRLTVG